MTKTADPAPARHTINWFEIPVTDIERAAAFYGSMLGIFLPIEHMEEHIRGAFFPGGEHVIHGMLIHAPNRKPSADGVQLYLNANPDLTPALERARHAGAAILQEKTGIGSYGFMAVLMDTEGNRIALHSEQ